MRAARHGAFAIAARMGGAVAAVAMGLGLPFTAQAGEGVLEINQACALNAGCFSGDSPGFPVTIDGSAGRSYRLTGDLSTGGDSDADAISITASDVTIDLGGFRVKGPRPCTGICPGPGNGNGIVAEFDTARIEVRNGSIVGFDVDGVRLVSGGVVRNARAAHNGNNGIHIGAVAAGVAIVMENIATDNSANGIFVNGKAIVSGNTASDNGDFGLVAGADTAYRENVFVDNTDGAVSGPGVNRGANFCAGPGVVSGFCP